MNRIDNTTKEIIKNACKKMSGFKKRQYQAGISLKYFNGNARKTEREMNWGRQAVEKGLGELRTGIRCIGNHKQCGRTRTEDKISNLAEDIRDLAEPQTQADPAMQSSLTFTRITSKAMRQALIDVKGYTDEELPCVNTVGNILDRLGYNLKRVIKSKPAKKIPEVNEIFENVWQVNRQSDENPESLRISIDAKAKVNVGNFSRNGKSRDKETKKAEDHDMNPKLKLVPYGILNVLSGLVTFFSGLRLRPVIL